MVEYAFIYIFKTVSDNNYCEFLNNPFIDYIPFVCLFAALNYIRIRTTLGVEDTIFVNVGSHSTIM